MFPDSGGVYVYLREAFGPLPAFLYGWAAFFVFWSGGIAAVAVGFAEYMRYFTPQFPAPVLAATAITVLGGINYVGVRTGNAANVVLTIAKVAGLAALPAMAIFAAKGTPHWTPVVPPIANPLAAFGAAMIAVLVSASNLARRHAAAKASPRRLGRPSSSPNTRRMKVPV